MYENRKLQNTSSGYIVETERLRERIWTAKDKLDEHHQTRTEEHGH